MTRRTLFYALGAAFSVAISPKLARRVLRPVHFDEAAFRRAQQQFSPWSQASRAASAVTTYVHVEIETIWERRFTCSIVAIAVLPEYEQKSGNLTHLRELQEENARESNVKYAQHECERGLFWFHGRDIPFIAMRILPA